MKFHIYPLELLDKYVGEAERNVRKLFQDAEVEWRARGAESELHLIILDEIDSIAKRRGSLDSDGSVCFSLLQSIDPISVLYCPSLSISYIIL